MPWYAWLSLSASFVAVLLSLNANRIAAYAQELAWRGRPKG